MCKYILTITRTKEPKDYSEQPHREKDPHFTWTVFGHKKKTPRVKGNLTHTLPFSLANKHVHQ